MPGSREPLFSIWKSDAHKIERPIAAEPRQQRCSSWRCDAGISIVIVAAVQAIGGSTQGMFTAVLNALTAG
jgi:hypothetical protein